MTQKNVCFVLSLLGISLTTLGMEQPPIVEQLQEDKNTVQRPVASLQTLALKKLVEALLDDNPLDNAENIQNALPYLLRAKIDWDAKELGNIQEKYKSALAKAAKPILWGSIPKDSEWKAESLTWINNRMVKINCIKETYSRTKKKTESYDINTHQNFAIQDDYYSKVIECVNGDDRYFFELRRMGVNKYLFVWDADSKEVKAQLPIDKMRIKLEQRNGYLFVMHDEHVVMYDTVLWKECNTIECGSHDYKFFFHPNVNIMGIQARHGFELSLYSFPNLRQFVR